MRGLLERAMTPPPVGHDDTGKYMTMLDAVETNEYMKVGNT